MEENAKFPIQKFKFLFIAVHLHYLVYSMVIKNPFSQYLSKKTELQMKAEACT